MLLVKGKNLLNQQVADGLLLKYFDKNSKNQFILDIDQQFFTHKLSPEQFASWLMAESVPATVDNIYLMVSEVEKDYSLGVFAHKLSRILAEHYQRNITIHIPSYLSCSKTLLVPPGKEGKWKIFGINNTDLKSETESYESLLKNKNKRCIFEDEDILKWMDDPQQIFDVRGYVWES